VPVVHPRYRAAAVQAAPVYLDLDASIDKAVALIADAARQGCSLIAFPETWLPGYPWFAWLDSPAWGMQFIQRYHDNSLVYGTPQAARLAAAARQHAITVVVGHSERAGGSLYMGQWTIGPDGETIAIRRKLKPTHVERTIFGEGDGSHLSVHATPLGRIGALCCWEHLQPLTKYAMYAQDEQVHVAAWPSFSLYRGGAYALGPEVNNAASRTYAVEGQCFVLAPCATVSKEMVEMLCTDDTKRMLLQEGGGFTVIYAPDGRALAQASSETSEELVIAEIDLGTISLAKAAADPAGPLLAARRHAAAAEPDPRRPRAALLDAGRRRVAPGARRGRRRRRRVAHPSTLTPEARAMDTSAPPPIESAIPPNLQCPRTRHKRVPDDYVPPYPSYVARFAPDVEQVVMMFLGLQHDASADPARVRALLDGVTGRFAAADGPGHHDRAKAVDAAGFVNVVSIAYWTDPAAFSRWFDGPTFGAWWRDAARLDEGVGWFVEVVMPHQRTYETLFSSTDRPEGVAVLAEGMSGMVQEHAYWGGARDRMPASQVDAMRPEGRPVVEAEGDTRGRRVRVIPHENLCLIRSGQDWGDTDEAERAMYFGSVEPTLREGMDFLRDAGAKVGCYDNRYMDVVGPDGGPTSKSFGMSWWRGLAELERWAESHPTHVGIFGASMRHLSTLGPAARLRLYHEVTVARAAEQRFEYVNCHPGTGMLRARSG
jgi:aliphatic nitrilase